MHKQQHDKLTQRGGHTPKKDLLIFDAYAKVQEKLGHQKKMIESLERAVKIEPSIQSYHILADAYERTGQTDKAGELRARIEKAVASKNPPARSVHQVRKVQM